MLCYNGIDVSKNVDVNKKKCLKKMAFLLAFTKDLSFNHMSVMVAMMHQKGRLT